MELIPLTKLRDYLSVGYTTLYNWYRLGKLPLIKKNGRNYITQEVYDEFSLKKRKNRAAGFIFKSVFTTTNVNDSMMNILKYMTDNNYDNTVIYVHNIEYMKLKESKTISNFDRIEHVIVTGDEIEKNLSNLKHILRKIDLNYLTI